MFHIQSRSHKPYTASVTANGNPLRMEIDTGASVLIIVSEDTFKSIRRGRSTTLELQNTTVKLQTFTRELIKVCGSTLVSIEHNGQTATLPLIVQQGVVLPYLLEIGWQHYN